MLDNDETFPVVSDHVSHQFGEDVFDTFPEMDSFDDYLGWSDGVVELLEVIGVKGEPV